MGALILPPSGLIYLDSSPIIYSLEKIEPYCSQMAPLWTAVSNGKHRVVTSELSWLETLTKPLRENNAPLETLYRDFLSADELDLIPVNIHIWEQAARLRGLGLKTADALHAATAIAVACTAFITNDPVFSRVPNLHAVVLCKL